jgi:hypothetical protein
MSYPVVAEFVFSDMDQGVQVRSFLSDFCLDLPDESVLRPSIGIAPFNVGGVLLDILTDRSKDRTHFVRVDTIAVPIVDLQGEQDADHHQHDLADGVQEVAGEAILFYHALADMAEEFDHDLF